MTAEQTGQKELPLQLRLSLKGRSTTLIVLENGGKNEITPSELAPRREVKQIIEHRTVMEAIQSVLSVGAEDADLTALGQAISGVPNEDRNPETLNNYLDEILRENGPIIEGSKMGFSSPLASDVKSIIINLAEEIWTEPDTTK